MATVINNPDSGDRGGGTGMIVGAIVLVLVIIIFLVYGLPALRGAGNGGGTTVNVPDKVDVNVTNGSGGGSAN